MFCRGARSVHSGFAVGWASVRSGAGSGSCTYSIEDDHAVKRTPTEVRRAVAHVLLNARKHFRQPRRRMPPVVLDGASSGLWFDGWKGHAPPCTAADLAAVQGLAALA